MATKIKPVLKKNRLPKEKNGNVTLMNQSKRSFHTNTSDVISGGEIAEYSQGKKMAVIPAGARVVVTRAYGKFMAKNYKDEIILLE